jgi:SulP family sulfate permease
MSGVPTVDSTAERNIEDLLKFCEDRSIHLIFSHVNPQPYTILQKNGVVDKLGAERFCPNIDDAIELATKLISTNTEK